MLHTVTSSPTSTQALANCLRYAQSHSEILLLSDAVTAAVKDSKWHQQLKASGLHIYVLQSDIEARGLQGRIASECDVVDMAGFVALTERHVMQLKW